MERTVLVVDDEVQILRALRRLFMKNKFKVFYTTNGFEALTILEQHPIDILITDIRMPEIDGIELLTEVKKKYPKTIRIALSGYTDNKKIFKAIEGNLAKLYLFKPWDNRELLKVIDQLFEFEQKLKDKNLLQLINSLGKLPTLPSLFKQLNRMIENDKNIEEISNLIEKDQSISSKILKVANSAYYNRKTGNIVQAIMYIGLLNTKSIVLANSVFGKISNQSKKEIFWEHTSYVNKLTNAIYTECLDKKIPNLYASAGLLHDVGRVVMLLEFEEQYMDIIQKAEEEDMSIIDVEIEEIGISHAEIGGYLLNFWELPLPIVETALYHHEPMNDQIINREIVQVVHIANKYCWSLLDAEIEHLEIDERVFDELGITEKMVEDLVDQMKKETY